MDTGALLEMQPAVANAAGCPPRARVRASEATIASRLLLLVAFAALPATLLLAVRDFQHYTERRAEVRESTMRTSRALAQVIDAQMREVQAALVAVASSGALHAGDLRVFHQEAQALIETGLVANVLMLSPSGDQLLNTLRPYGTTLGRPQGASRLADVFAARGPVVDDLFTGPVSGEPFAAVGVPVRVAGELKYALHGEITPERLQQTLMSQPLPPGWVAAILDRKGIVVARTRAVKEFFGRPATPETLREVFGPRAEGSFRSTTLDGVAVTVSFSKAPWSGWTVAIGIPEAELDAPMVRSFALSLLALGTVMALSLVAALRLAAQVNGSVQQLVGFAHRLGRGETFDPAAVSLRESRVVADAMAAAATTLRQARLQLEREEARLEAVLSSVGEGIIVAAADRRIASLNPAGCELFGWTPEQAVGQPLEAFVPSAQRERARRIVERYLARPRRLSHGSKAGGGLVGLRRDGSVFRMAVSISTARVGAETFLVAVVRDVTDLMRTRDALVRSNIDLRQFAYVASHDIRAPLRTINGYLEVLAARFDSRLGDDGIRLVERALRAATQLDALTSDLLTYARLDAAEAPSGDVDLHALVEDTRQVFAAIIAAKGASLEFSGTRTVRANASQLTQVIQNLVGNGLKYNNAAVPRVLIECEADEGEWRISVSDNGIGIEPRHHERVFEAFRRLHTQSEYPGTGIGLAICRRIVEKHGGRIWLRSQPGAGSTFTFTIPRKGAST